MRLSLTAEVTTFRSPDDIFETLTAPGGLSWIESPWTLRTAEGFGDGDALIWALGRRAVRSVVSAARPSSIRWYSEDVTGEISIRAEDEVTAVTWTGTFRAKGRGLTDVLLGAFAQGKMNRIASDASSKALAEMCSGQTRSGEELQ